MSIFSMMSVYLLAVAFVFATTKDATEHFRVQRLHASAEDGGVGGQFFYLAASVDEAFDELLCTACGKEFYVLGTKFLKHFSEAVFVIDRDERSLYFLCFSHVVVMLFNCMCVPN